MIAGVLVVAANATVAFFILDLFFRSIDLTDPLRSLRRVRPWYLTIATVGSGSGIWLAWHWGDVVGLLVAVAGVPIWWVLWRFGIRKQFPHLFSGS